MAKKILSAAKMVGGCPKCESTRLMRYFEDADIVCTSCGSVITADIANRDAERSGKRQEELANRDGGFGATSGPSLLLNSVGSHDATLNLKFRDRLVEMWRRAAGVSDSTEERLALAFSEILKIGSILSLPIDVLEKASTMYKTIVEKGLVKGRKMRILSVAAVYLACKQVKLPHTLNEVAKSSGIDRREVGRGYRFLIRKLGCTISPVKPSRYLRKFADRIAISEKTEQIIDKILNASEGLKLTNGRDPMGVLAASSYIASRLTGEKKTQREIAEIARITEATIRNRCKELTKRLLFIIAV